MGARPLINLVRRFKSPLIALVALTLSASLVAASQPAAPSASGLANASSHAGKTVPVQSGDEATGNDESNDSTEKDDSSDSANQCNVDLTGDLSSFSHGEIVCTAAQMTTPSGYANHGAWVSHWAKMQGAAASAAGKAHKPSK